MSGFHVLHMAYSASERPSVAVAITDARRMGQDNVRAVTHLVLGILQRLLLPLDLSRDPLVLVLLVCNVVERRLLL
jgi:hypothetical protein